MKSLSGEVARTVKNAGWMLSEQIAKIFASFFVSIYIARSLGSESFGVLSYTTAIFGVFAAVSKIGMESILVRELAKRPFLEKSFMGTAFWLITASSAIGIMLMAGINIFETQEIVKTCTLILSIGLLFQSSLVFDYYFQARLQSKSTTIAKSTATTAGAIIKILIVTFSPDMILITISYVIDQILMAILLLVAYKKSKGANFLFSYQTRRAQILLKSSVPMMLSGIAGMIMLRCDQIMLKYYLGTDAVGIYAAGSKIYEGWLILPFIFSISLLPLLTKEKEKDPVAYEKKLSFFFGIQIWAAIIFAAILTVAGKTLINLTFGPDYIEAYETMVVLAWTSVFTAAGYMSARYLVLEKMEKKITKRNWIALSANIALNTLLIPAFGTSGAATSTFLSMMLAHFVFDYLDRDLKRLRDIKIRSILLKPYWR